MTDAGIPNFRQADGSQRGAGELLRIERERQGLSVEALSSIIKVVPAKIQALESGDFSALDDANFVRALAQTVCRALRMDAGPVLASLPPAQPARLHDEHAPLNQPLPQPGSSALFSVRGVGVGFSGLLGRKWFWPLCIVIAAALVWWWPSSWGWSSWKTPVVASAVLPASSVVPSRVEATVAISAVPLTEELAASEPLMATVVSDSVSEPVVTVSGMTVVMVASQPSWVELTESLSGRKLFARLVSAGERIELSGMPPFEAVIGNADGVRIEVAGRLLDLVPHVRNNVARLTVP